MNPFISPPSSLPLILSLCNNSSSPAMSTSSSLSGFLSLQKPANPSPQEKPPAPQREKRKRNQPGNPDPAAEVIALSPRTLMATNRFLCEICGKGFQRDQNLQLHLRGHNLPWKLKQKDTSEAPRKKVYVCPEESCTHHHPSRALGDLTGIKKHFWRKHGEKRWACEKCSKKYAVMSDWKAHEKTCGTREYKCSCGTIFSRKDSYATHKAFCEALAEESAKYNASLLAATTDTITGAISPGQEDSQSIFQRWEGRTSNPNPNPNYFRIGTPPFFFHAHQIPYRGIPSSPFFSAGSLLQGAETSGTRLPWQRGESQLTRDFLGVTDEPELDLLSMIEAGGLTGGADFMVSHPPPPLTGAPSDRVSHSTSFTSPTNVGWWGGRN